MGNLKLENLGKELIVTDNAVIIQQKIIKSSKIIPLTNIISVQVKKPGLMAGYIYFQTLGGLDNRIKKPADISKDENSFIFNGNGNYKIAMQMKEQIENCREQSSTSVVQENSSADEILKYKGLFDAGIITQAEFEAKKEAVIGTIGIRKKLMIE